jgi:hypothetical protein
MHLACSAGSGSEAWFTIKKLLIGMLVELMGYLSTMLIWCVLKKIKRPQVLKHLGLASTT